MSKLQLKKELNGMSKEQLTELILDMYSARPDAKAYFEFFLNPDVEKLFDKYAEKIDTEFRRNKYRRTKARISKVKAAVKEFASFNPGAEYVMKLRFHALVSGWRAVRIYDYTHLLSDTILLFLEDTAEYADKNGVFKIFVTGLEEIEQKSGWVFEGSEGRRIREMIARLNANFK